MQQSIECDKVNENICIYILENKMESVRSLRVGFDRSIYGSRYINYIAGSKLCVIHQIVCLITHISIASLSSSSSTNTCRRCLACAVGRLLASRKLCVNRCGRC